VIPVDVEAERREVAAIFGRWMQVAHGAARRRSGVAFREAADMQDLWRWLHKARWGCS
jgi:hypothetical protein